MSAKDNDILRIMAQLALLDEVTPNLRGVAIGIDEKNVYFTAIYDGEISDDNYDSMWSVSAEILSHFPNHGLDEKIIRVDYPKNIQNYRKQYWAYLRKEAR